MATWLSKRNGYRFLLKIQEVCKDDNYDFSRVLETYVNNRTNVCIIDKSINPETGEEYGEFWMTPSNLLKGRKNPKGRGKRISEAKTMTTATFIKKAKETHNGENLDYSRTVYKGAHEKVFIIDHSINPDTGEEYGGYWQEASAHLKGCGHPDKGIHRASKSRKKFTLDVIRKDIEKIFPGNSYYIPDQEITNSKTKIRVICTNHGEFLETPNRLLNGFGCPFCGEGVIETEIYNFLVDIFGVDNVEVNNRTILDNDKSIDYYIPSKKFGVIYNAIKEIPSGFIENRHFREGNLSEAKEKGVTLIHIFEDEFLAHRDIVFSKLRHILGLDLGLVKVAARKCVVREITKRSEAKAFLDRYHIQGYGSATVNLGCFYKNSLIAVMSFKQESDGCWNLTRFASDTNVVCQGVGGKLFKYFIRNYNPMEVKTFLDRRWEHNVDNNLYIRMGFKVDKIEAPDYMYTDGHGGSRQHKFGFRKQILSKKYGLPLSMTEGEMVKELGYYKVWNCGLIKYIWRKEE